MEEPGDRPGLLVLPVRTREAAHRRLDREAVLAKALRLGVLAQKGPSLITRHSLTSPRDPSERVTVGR